MKKVWLGVLLLALFTFMGGCSQSSGGSEKEDGKKVVKVAISDEVNPPFLYADEKNNPIGYDMDYMKEVEKKLPEYTFEYIWGEEESNLVGVDTGKYDFAINWFFKNPEREEKFLYPEHEFGYSLTSLVTKKDRNDIKTLDDMVGKKFPPMSPSGGLRTILNAYNEQHPDRPLTIESMDAPSNAENLKLVAKGKADAMFINVTTFNEIQKELNLDLKVAGIISKEPIWTVYNKDNEELANKIDEVTVELREDGTLSKLAEKWFGVDFFQDLKYINEEGFKFEK
ncbi:transporter substrate-binding domain-containing protein [Siminovitchia sp. 179-K 8D1 HS]|uniref:transporter substrate-binding domain-containing protein n=1 Tax=Siminovitchia sp. 179-K 8D1 HS TaxID=3142385 RepID=UPI0039A257C6